MDLSLLETMRYKIMTGKDFSEIFNYFFDNFGENRAFMDACVPSPPEDNAILTQLLEHIGGAIFKTNKARVDIMGLLKIGRVRFRSRGRNYQWRHGDSSVLRGRAKGHPRAGLAKNGTDAVYPLLRRDAAAQSCERVHEIQSIALFQQQTAKRKSGNVLLAETGAYEKGRSIFRTRGKAGELTAYTVRHQPRYDRRMA